MNGYEDPICSSYENTSTNYNEIVKRMILESLHKNDFYLVATHNEESILKAINTMNEIGIPPKQERVVFAQIYGMAEQISLPLGKVIS